MYAGNRIGNQSISTSSSAISAYWPGFSETLNDFRRYTGDLRVGLIEHFLLHTVHLTRQGSTLVQKVDYLLAYVSWKEVHRYPLWFGMDSLLSSCDHESPPSSFILVARIKSRCAHTTLRVQFNDISNIAEKVFVAVPLGFRLVPSYTTI